MQYGKICEISHRKCWDFPEGGFLDVNHWVISPCVRGLIVLSGEVESSRALPTPGFIIFGLQITIDTMNAIFLSLTQSLVCILLLAEVITAQESDVLFDPESQVTLLAGDFAFTEGPAADRAGNVYFTDQPNNKIWVWTIEGKLELFTDQSGRSNGLYFDHQDRLLACADMDNELWRFDHSTQPEVLLSEYNGSQLNGPNDLWIRPDGKMYFTDPLYARDYWTRDPAMQ